MTSVTDQLAEWIVKASYEDIPDVGPERVEERFVDCLGVQFAGMSVPTGDHPGPHGRGAGPRRRARVVGRGFKSTAALATLANATAGHALEFDDIAAFSGHYANPLTAATLAVGEKLDASGRDVILAWMVGYEVICQTAKPAWTSHAEHAARTRLVQPGLPAGAGSGRGHGEADGPRRHADPDGARTSRVGHGRGA